MLGMIHSRCLTRVREYCNALLPDIDFDTEFEPENNIGVLLSSETNSATLMIIFKTEFTKI